MYYPVDPTILAQILDQLKQAGQLTPLKMFQTVTPIVSSVLSAFLAAFLGYRVSRSHEKRKSKREMHFELLKSLNTYLFTVNDLMTCIAGINKLNYIMLKDITSDFNFDPNGDYYTIAITSKRLKQFIESGTGVQHLKDKKTIDYSKDLIGMIDKVIDFGLFIRAGTELEQKAVNYLLLVDKDIRDGYEIIRDEIANSSRDDMREFKLIEHKKSVVDFIFKLNERIKKYS